MTTYVALVDGKAGAFGVVFPDCPGCTAMGRTVEEALANAAEALAEWAEDVRRLPKPRTIEQIRRDAAMQRALSAGNALAIVPLGRKLPRPAKPKARVLQRRAS